ncbi:sialate O-acetylesterase [Flammeovirga yaeyamensis]|uniref:Sialate O-acetylesterase n=1 Tax=Flammeovirga yaeyamensis TaxID=367791 RepID=A0AAX1N1P6_9BACT|nr:sialate O-acetylesterase [Flammeovirga yaeyamensis]MBB3698241.1 sialate O-acetylesterase [Flammeovirga yaeyamensis]NMF34404.1 sialate O-acetylesterase [Flammeovirga yaeyamensis]QWG01384.1 sialate O-acetylesterase [Flammeovirga yaeyamensis]
MKNYILLLLSFFCFQGVYALELPSFFSDGMLLQQSDSVSIFGWEKAKTSVRISSSWGEEVECRSNKSGFWSVKLKTPKGSFDTHQLSIKGKESITIKDILIGEVWLASGQSNMEWSASAGLMNDSTEIKNAHQPMVRIFKAERNKDGKEGAKVEGEWLIMTPKTMPYVSVVSYFFATKLKNQLMVPVGVITTSWGGTPIETWIPKKALQNDKDLWASSQKLKPNPWGPVEQGLLYNGMVAPFKDYTISGLLWYQGEANVEFPELYAEKLKLLGEIWRQQFKKNLPLYYVQIAPYHYGDNINAAKLRDQQRRTMNILSNSKMLVISDVADLNDIHPINKKPVGHRLANIALKDHYGILTKEVYSPVIERIFTDYYGRLHLAFKNAKGLHFASSDINYFEVGNEQSTAKATDISIENDQIILKSPIENPEWVRFAFTNSATPGIVNEGGIPVSCFDKIVFIKEKKVQ